MADVDFTIDDAKLTQLIGNSPQTKALVERYATKVASRANSMSAGFRTKVYQRPGEDKPVGGKAPKYKVDVKKKGRYPVGIVVTGNYAAIKDNHLHNTLAKSL